MKYGKYKHPRLPKLIAEYQPQTVLELGSLLGKSAIAMAIAGRDAGIESMRIYCVDTWLGAIENWKRGYSKKAGWELLELDETGRPQFYNRFLDNIRKAGVADIITPLSMTTRTGFQYIGHCGIVPDLIYIDASHEYKDVLEDIESAMSVVKTGGIICGDDYENKPGVTQAVNDTLGRSGVNIEKTFWWSFI